MRVRRSRLGVLLVLGALGTGCGAKPKPAPIGVAAPPSFATTSVSLSGADIPFRQPPSRASLEVSQPANGIVHWAADAGLGADAYDVIVRVGGENRLLTTTTRMQASLPAGASLVGVQPVRGKLVGPLVKPSKTAAVTSPLTRWRLSPLRRLMLSERSDFAAPHPESVGWTLDQADVQVTAAAPGLKGSARLRLTGDGTQSSVAVRLLPGLVSAEDAAGNALTVTRANGIVTVALGSTPASGATTEVDLTYTITNLTASNPAFGTVAEATASYLFFSPGVAAWPIPEGLAPGSTPVSLTVAVPAGWEAASGGPRTENGTSDTFSPAGFPVPSWPGLAMGAYQSATASFSDGTIEVLGLKTAKGAPESQSTADAMAKAADFYAGWGKPSRDWVSVAAVSPNHGGSSSYGLIMVPDYVLVQPPAPAVDFFYFHELSHQWWGGVVFVQSPLDLWLREGMADYSSMRALAVVDGAAAAAQAWQNEHDSLINLMKNGYGGNPGRDVPVRPATTGELQDYIYYLKGALVLRHLTAVVGDQTMDAALTSYLADYRHKAAGTTDFEQEVEAKAGVSLTWFWHEWLSGTGLPDLTWAPYFDPTDPSKVTIFLTETGDRPFTGQPWTLPVEVKTPGWSGWICVDALSQAVPLGGSATTDALNACH